MTLAKIMTFLRNFKHYQQISGANPGHGKCLKMVID